MLEYKGDQIQNRFSENGLCGVKCAVHCFRLGAGLKEFSGLYQSCWDSVPAARNPRRMRNEAKRSIFSKLCVHPKPESAPKSRSIFNQYCFFEPSHWTDIILISLCCSLFMRQTLKSEPDSSVTQLLCLLTGER